MCVQLCVRMQGPLKQKDGIATKCSTNYRKLYELSCNVLGLSAPIWTLSKIALIVSSLYPLVKTYLKN